MRFYRRGLGAMAFVTVLAAVFVVCNYPRASVSAQDAEEVVAPAEEAPAKEPAFDPEMPPVVVKTVPAMGDKSVDPRLEELKITFDRPMNTENYSWMVAPALGAKPMRYKPVARWEDDGRTCCLQANLQAGTIYAFGANHYRSSSKTGGFMSVDGKIAVPYWVVFKTAGQKGRPYGELP